MNKIFNWLFGACFRTLGRFLAILIVLLSLLFIGSKLDIDFTSLFGLMSVNASTLTSYDTWTQYQNNSTSCGTSGKYSYTTTTPNVHGLNIWESGSLNTTISGKAHDLAFSFNQTLLANTYYDITINFISNDLRYYVTRDDVILYSGNTCQTFNENNIAIVSFTNNATSSKNTNVLKLRIFNANVSNYWTLLISGEQNFLTSVNTFGIKSISITQVEDNSTEDIINNNNQNTEDIINNNNANTDKIEGAINDNLNSCKDSKNLLTFDNTSFTSNGVNFTSKDGVFTIVGTSTATPATTTLGYFALEPGTYYFSQHLSSSSPVTPNNYLVGIVKLEDGTFVKQGDGVFTLTEFTKLKLTTYHNENFKNLTFIMKPMINTGTSALPFEKGGKICQNKIDGVQDSLDNLNSSITDTSDVDISSLENMAGWLPPGPVDSILNLPLTMLNSLLNILTSTGCINTTLTLPFVNSDIVLPCVSSLYDKMGITGTIFNTAGLIGSAFLLFNYLLSLYKWVDDTLTFRENNYPGYFDDNWGGGA